MPVAPAGKNMGRMKNRFPASDVPPLKPKLRNEPKERGSEGANVVGQAVSPASSLLANYETNPRGEGAMWWAGGFVCLLAPGKMRNEPNARGSKCGGASGLVRLFARQITKRTQGAREQMWWGRRFRLPLRSWQTTKRTQGRGSKRGGASGFVCLFARQITKRTQGLQVRTGPRPVLFK